MKFTNYAIAAVTLCALNAPAVFAEGSKGADAKAARVAVPDDFPRFVVPGHEAEMASLRSLFWLHFQRARPLIPLWDEWLPNATLWPARGDGDELNAMRERWAAALAGRIINSEGYIHTQQHDGLAHAEGWPFPLWTQSGGIGWHFRGTGIAGYDAPLVTPENWQLTGADSGEVNDKGWIVTLSAPNATAEPPAITLNAANAPWLRLNWWAANLGRTDCFVEWTTQDEPEFAPERRAYFDAADADLADKRESRTMIPVYRIPGWKGIITRLRINFANAGGATVVIKSFHTACDTRHSVNNLNFIRGCHDYFLWTRDLSFLRNQMPRIRTAMRFVEREFQTREKKCIYTTWPGHEGRSGVAWHDGQKVVTAGQGIGSNYWDILPFGGEDALATVYYYDTLIDLAELEELVARNPQWTVATGGDAYDPTDLRRHAQEAKDYAGKRFWNNATGRFGTVDLDGNLHDYGFTFLNNEAVVFGFATPEQANSIHAWLSGARTVDGDTATCDDIYHWRFGPRSTTKRNLDYYFWAWSNPESIPWGYQVQDGGAVLGWSYYDLMARLKSAGPDDAAARLKEIAQWFDETQADGGYREFYGKDTVRGTMQGANVAGGLGLDKEFFESVLVTQVMLYGFLGFQPTADGFSISPQLPDDWPELTITRIHLRDYVLDITARRDGSLSIAGTGPAGETLIVHAPAGTTLTTSAGVKAKVENFQ